MILWHRCSHLLGTLFLFKRLKLYYTVLHKQQAQCQRTWLPGKSEGGGLKEPTRFIDEETESLNDTTQQNCVATTNPSLWVPNPVTASQCRKLDLPKMTANIQWGHAREGNISVPVLQTLAILSSCLLPNGPWPTTLKKNWAGFLMAH